jgi:hypothetical protein
MKYEDTAIYSPYCIENKELLIKKGRNGGGGNFFFKTKDNGFYYSER